MTSGGVKYVILIVVNVAIFKLRDDEFFAFGDGEEDASIAELVEDILESGPGAINAYFRRVI